MRERSGPGALIGRDFRFEHGQYTFGAVCSPPGDNPPIILAERLPVEFADGRGDGVRVGQHGKVAGADLGRRGNAEAAREPVLHVHR